MYSQQSPVYYDAETGQYYTLQNQNPFGAIFNGFGRYGNYAKKNYITNSNADTSVVNQLLANQTPYQYNVPSIAQMFPSMNTGGDLGGLLGGNIGQFLASAGGQSSGAGRFL